MTVDILDQVDRQKGVAQYIRYLMDALERLDSTGQYGRIRFCANPGPGETCLPMYPVPSKFASKVLGYYRHGDDVLSTFDVLHLTAPRLYYLPWLGRSDAATVMTVHGLDLYVPPEFRARPTGAPASWLQQTLLDWTTPHVVRNVDAFIAVSDFLRRELVDQLGVPAERVHTVYHGVDDRFRPVETAHDRPYVLTDTPVSGVIEAFYGLRRRGIDHRLVVFGVRGYGYERARERADELGVVDAIDFVGHVDHENLVELYSGADVYVRVSGYEGFGMPVVEAMACGTPVVTNDVGSLPEVSGDAGVTWNGDDPTTLAENIHTLLTDEDRRRMVVDRGFERAAEFSWERTARETSAVYRSVADD